MKLFNEFKNNDYEIDEFAGSKQYSHQLVARARVYKDLFRYEESIKDCFSGKPIKEIKPIEFINGIHNSTKVQLMHHIYKANLISKSTQEENYCFDRQSYT